MLEVRKSCKTCSLDVPKRGLQGLNVHRPQQQVGGGFLDDIIKTTKKVDKKLFKDKHFKKALKLAEESLDIPFVKKLEKKIDKKSLVRKLLKDKRFKKAVESGESLSTFLPRQFPAAKLKKEILKQIGKKKFLRQGRAITLQGHKFLKQRGIDVPQIIAKKIMPAVIREISKKIPVLKKFTGSGMQRKLQVTLKQAMDKQLGGSILGALSIASALAPFAIEGAKIGVPILVDLFKRSRKSSRGKLGAGIFDSILQAPGKLMFNLFTDLVKKSLTKAIKKRQSGGRFKIGDIIKPVKQFSKKFVEILKSKQVRRLGKKAVEKGGPIALRLLQEKIIPMIEKRLAEQK